MACIQCGTVAIYLPAPGQPKSAMFSDRKSAILALTTIFKNASWLGLILALSYIIPFLTLPIVTRAFGLNTFGILSTFYAYGAFVAVITGFGFDDTGLRAIARSHVDARKMSKIVSNIAAAQFLLGAVAIAIFFVAIPLLPQGTDHKFVGLIVLIQMFATAATPQWVFIGLEQVRGFALIQCVLRTLAAILIVFAIRTPDDLFLYASINCAAAVIILIFSYIGLARYHIRWQMPGIGELVSTIRHASHLFFSKVSVSLYTSTTVLIVAFIMGPGAAGAFALADRARSVTSGVIGPFTRAIYPFVNRLADREETHEEAWTKRIFFRGVVALSALISIFLFIFAPLIIWFLGGRAFQDSILVLQIIALLPPIKALTNIFSVQTMIPLHMDRQLMWIVTSAALFGVTGVFVLTNYLALPGAALAVLAVEIYVTVACAFSVQRRKSILSLFFKSR